MRTQEQKDKHAAYMRKWYAARPGYKSSADRTYRKKHLTEVRERDRSRNQTPDRAAYRRAEGILRRAMNPDYKEYHKRYYQLHKDSWHKPPKTPERKLMQRGWGLKHRYGITLAQYEQMVAAQNGVCAICSRPPNGMKKRLHVDHDHRCCPGEKTCGKCIRGLLCMTCNLAVALLDEIEGWAAKAEVYLRKPR